MADAPKSRYQHFVPQFLVNNFSHPYKPEGEGGKKRKGGVKRKYEKGMFPKDPVVRNLDLLTDPPIICEKPVKRILGQVNMYQDTSKPTEQQQHVEKLFSVLEGRASEVFRKITKAFEQGEASLWLTRGERNLLRKFLFLLKYRGNGFRRRFFHQKPEDYNENDRELVQEYMAAHGFKRPLDVWFHNIKTIAESEMDLERAWPGWLMELRKKIYPEDAMWFATHVVSSYMAICTPTNPDDEFILTDNSYNIFEGPNRFAQDSQTGEVGALDYTPLHDFATISPKLMIVLRCNLLPNPLEDESGNIKEQREFLRFLALDNVYPRETKSLLADLPVKKASNNYTQIVDGKIRLVSGEDGKPKMSHKFRFEFFPISSHHVHTINALLLDNVSPCSSVVFESQESFARTLEWYLTAPCEIGKNLVDTDVDAGLREATLRKLENVSRDLGSQKDTIFVKVPNFPIVDYEGFRRRYLEWKRKMDRLMDGDADATLDNLLEMNEDNQRSATQPPNPDSAFWRTYTTLGGSVAKLADDLGQAQRMWMLRTKIDVWSKGKAAESVRQRGRELLRDEYLQLPRRRVWLYVKYARFAVLHVHYKLADDDDPFSGPEDVVVQARGIIRSDHLTKLMFVAGMNDIDKRSRPWLDLWNPFPVDDAGVADLMRRYSLLKMILFQTSGYIRNCGISEVEDLAQEAQIETQRKGMYNLARGLGMYDEGERVELLTRMMVRERFMDAVRGRWEPSVVRDMEEVLFETAYPTPPARWRFSI